MTEVFWVSFLGTIAHIPSLILRYLPFESKIEPKQRKLFFLIYGVALCLNFALYMWLGSHQEIGIAFYKLNMVFFCAFMAGVNMIVLRGYLREHLFVFGIVAIIVLLLLSISSYIVDLISYRTIQEGMIKANLILMVLFSALYVPIRRLLLHAVTPFLDISAAEYWRTIWFIPIAMFFASLLSIPLSEYTTTVFMAVSKLLIGTATLLICNSVAMDYQRMMERERLGQQIDLQKRYYEALSEKVNSERRQRHDFKHHIGALRYFIETEDLKGLSAYFEMYQQAQPAIADIPYTGNPAADGVLYHYAGLAKEKNIRFSVQCSLPNVTLPDMELCTLLGNALDNAVEASGSYDGERFIRVSARQEQELLMLTVDNSFDGKLNQKNGRILSKKRHDVPGIGIDSMRRVCEKYGGSCCFEATGNMFEASFILQCRG